MTSSTCTRPKITISIDAEDSFFATGYLFCEDGLLKMSYLRADGSAHVESVNDTPCTPDTLIDTVTAMYSDPVWSLQIDANWDAVYYGS